MTPVSDGRSADRPKLGERRSIRWAAQGVFVPLPASKRDGRAELAAQEAMSAAEPLTSVTTDGHAGPQLAERYTAALPRYGTTVKFVPISF